MEFAPIHRTGTQKIKLMLWMDKRDKDKLHSLKPYNVTVQEKIRQILKAFLEGDTSPDIGEEQFFDLDTL